MTYPHPAAAKLRGDLIRNRRREKGYTQAEIAACLGVEPTWYSRVESRGAGLDSVERLFMLAQILDMDFIALVRVGCNPPQGQLDKAALLDVISSAVEQLRNL